MTRNYTLTDAEGREVEQFDELIYARDAAETRANLYGKTYLVVSTHYPDMTLATCTPRT